MWYQNCNTTSISRRNGCVYCIAILNTRVKGQATFTVIEESLVHVPFIRVSVSIHDVCINIPIHVYVLVYPFRSPIP